MNWNDQVREIVLAGALIIAAFTTGCGARSDLKAIKGHVKFKNGEAIKRGTIEYRTKVAGVLARRVAAIAFDRAMGKTQGKTH